MSWSPTCTPSSATSTAAGLKTCVLPSTQRRPGPGLGRRGREPPGSTCSEYYQREVDPLLTPITIDPAHPFPRVLNKALCLALLLRRKRKEAPPARCWACSPCRARCRAWCRCPPAAGHHDFIFLHDLIEHNADRHVSRLRDPFAPPPSASRATAISISRKKNRAACWKACARNCTIAAKATRCAWRLRRAPTPRSSSACA